MPDPFADVAEPAPAPAVDPFADVSRPKTPDEMTPDEYAHAYPQSPYQQAVNAAAPPLQAAPAPTFMDRVGGAAKGIVGLPVALANEAVGQSAAGLSGLGAAFTGSKDFVDAANDINKETSQRTSGMEGGLPLGERAAEIGGSILPLLNPVTAPLVPAGMAGQGYVGATNEGATRGQALGKGAIMGAVGAALPGLGRTLAPAVAPVGEALANQVSPLAGRVATGLLQGGAAGTVLGGAEAGSTALYNPELASERFNDIPSSAGLLALLSGGHAALGRSPINPAAPVEPMGGPGLDLDPTARAAFEKTTDPFADVAVDQTIRPASDGAPLPAEDAANLRMPEPAPAEPTQEQVAADSTPQADAAHAATLDPLDAHDPEQIGALGRASGGEETVTDMSPVLENRRKLAEMDARRAAAEEPTQELPPVDPQDSTPTEQLPRGGDFRDSIGESGPQETLREPPSATLESASVPAELGRSADVESPEGLPRADVERGPAGMPAASDVSHLASDAQESYAKLPPEVQNHPVVQETVASRKTANDAIGDKGNVEQAAEFARASIVRAKRKAEKVAAQPAATAPEIPSAKEIPSPGVKSEPTAQAPGDRVNLDPKHAMMGEDGQARDAEKMSMASDAPRTPQKLTDIDAKAGQDIADAGGHHAVAEHLMAKASRGEAWTPAEVAQEKKVYTALVKSDPAKAQAFRQIVKQQRSDHGLMMRMHVDGLQDPEARHAESIGIVHDATPAEARPIQRLQQEQAQDKAKHARTGRTPGPPKEAPSEASAAKDLKDIRKEQRAKLDEEAKALKKKLIQAISGHGPLNALGGRSAELLYQLLENRVKAGVSDFVTLVRQLRTDLPAIRNNPDLQESIEQGWERMRHDNPKLEEGSSVKDALAAIEEKRLAGLEDRLKDRETRLTKMTPDERAAELQREKDDGETPADIAKMRADAQDRRDKISARIQDLEDSSTGASSDLYKGGEQSELPGAKEAIRAKKVLEKRMAERQVKIDALLKAQEKNVEKRKAYLKKWGFDVDDPNASFKHNPHEWEDFLHHVEASGQKFWGVTRNTLIGWKHASLAVPAVKWASDVSNTLTDGLARIVKLPIQTLGEAAGKGYDMARGRDSRSIQAWEEFKAYGKAILPAMYEGTKNFGKSIYREKPVGAFTKVGNDLGHPPSPFTSNLGKAGTVLRQASMLPMVQAEDAAFKTFAGLTDVASRAHASAVDEAGKRLTGDAYAAHLKKEMEDPGSESWRKAYEFAQHQTFTNPIPILDYVMGQVRDGESTPALVKAFANQNFPFVRIATNVLLKGLNGVPGIGDIAALASGMKYSRDEGWHIKYDDVPKLLAKSIVRIAIAGTVVNLLSKKDKDGNAVLTGYAPAAEGKNGFAVNHQAPHSLRLWGHSFDINRIGWVGKAMGLIADAANGKFRAGWGEAMKNEALIKPFVDINRAVDDQAKYGDGAARYIANQVPFVSAVGQIVRGQDDTERAMREPGQKPARTVGGQLAAIPGQVAHEIAAKYNPTILPAKGGGIQKDAFKDSPILTELWRMMSPAQLGHTPEYYKAR